MELSHESHEHYLFFDAGESDTDELVECWGCGHFICGARYSCSACDFHLHKSCTELPPRLEDHPFHPQHPLSLLPRHPSEEGSYFCDACHNECQEMNFVYRCSICNFDLHIMCALSVDRKVSIISGRNGEELFRCGAYQHLLMLQEEQSTSLGMDREICFLCEESMSAPFFFCSKSRCRFCLHKSCADLPQQIRINFFHPQLPLFLFSGASKDCQICGRWLNFQDAYVCIQCDFFIHSRCAFSNSNDVIKRNRERWVLEEQGLRRIVRADEQPQQIQNTYFHPQHPLCLDAECSGKCKICGQETDQPTYACKPCDFFCHLRCALLNPTNAIKRVGENQFRHSRHDHYLTLLQDMREWRLYTEKGVPICNLCYKKVDSFPTYVCQLCNFTLHKSCAELPTKIKSHFHLDHFLFSLPTPPRGELYCGCSCCGLTIFGHNYHCIQCGFSLHVHCFLSLQGFEQEQLYDHKHCFIDLKTFNKLSCQACGEEGYFSPWQCSSCHVLVHKNCAALPSILKQLFHHHPLKLTYYLSLVHKCDENQTLCKFCHRKINVDYAAYYCSKCHYAIHLECGQKVAGQVLEKQLFGWQEEEDIEEENQDNQHSSTESQNLITNADITSSQEEDIKSGVILHFSHKHELTLIEQDLEDHKYCEGCVALIFPPFYSCKQCNFYLHKRCGESPITIEHPFHDHHLTLNVVEDLVWCDECGYFCNGFMYSCQAPDCTFNLDLQCADILSEGLQHPCHEHPLFFPCTGEYKECKGCGMNQAHILVCSECDYVLGYCCLRISHVAKHRYDNHMLKLAYKDDESGEYYCDICEEERDPKVWYYHCSQCEFFAHIGCTLGQFPHLKCGMTVKSYSHNHLLTLVEKCQRKIPPLCSSCGKHCYSKVLECCQCNLHFHFNCSCPHSY